MLRRKTEGWAGPQRDALGGEVWRRGVAAMAGNPGKPHPSRNFSAEEQSLEELREGQQNLLPSKHKEDLWHLVGRRGRTPPPRERGQTYPRLRLSRASYHRGRGTPGDQGPTAPGSAPGGACGGVSARQKSKGVGRSQSGGQEPASPKQRHSKPAAVRQ